MTEVAMGRDEAVDEAVGAYMGGRQLPAKRRAAFHHALRECGYAVEHAGLAKEVEFLLERIADLDWSLSWEKFARDFDGHVEPSIARLRAMLEAAR